MKSATITDMQITPCDLSQEDKDWRYAGGAIPTVTGWMVTLTLGTGVTGHGYSQAVGISSDTPAGAKAVLDALVPVVVGQCPHNIERIWRDMDRCVHGHLHAKSGVDFALHELSAKVLDVPLSTLFGGALTDSINNTRIVPICDPKDAADKAAVLAAEGYRNLKIKMDGNASLDVERLRLVRAKVGDDIRLCVDPNQSYSTKGALMTLRQIEKYGVDLAEQPVQARNLSGLKLLRENLDMHVEADEAVQNLDDVMKIIRADAADCMNFKVSRMGGLRNTMIAARMCHVAGIGYRIGAAFGPRIYTAQIAHLVSSFGTHFYPHELAEFEHLGEDPSHGLAVKNGVLPVPDGPGCGVAVTL
ncbi:MAG: enolase C-terminal domain-like protein [Sulfitobacter sp.]